MSFILPKWSLPKNVKAISSTRAGGFSQGDFASLNLGMHVSDDVAVVQKNRDHLQAVSGMPSAPVWMNQTHSTVVASVSESTAVATESDALVTSAPNVVLSVMTADCYRFCLLVKTVLRWHQPMLDGVVLLVAFLKIL